MRATVAGSMFLSNGHDTPLHMDADLDARLVGNVQVHCHFKLMGGHFVCDLDGIPDVMGTEDVLRAARHLMDTVVLSQVVTDRVGIHYTVEYCNIEGRGMVTPTTDTAPAIPALAFANIQDVFDIVGRHGDSLKYALRDYNQGLLDRENCPILFYRCIETLALLITGADDINDKTWASFHQALGSDKNELATLMKFTKSHRHGSHAKFELHDHLAMMRETHVFILRALHWLKNRAAK